jgi:hypothetical protein
VRVVKREKWSPGAARKRGGLGTQMMHRQWRADLIGKKIAQRTKHECCALNEGVGTGRGSDDGSQTVICHAP